MTTTHYTGQRLSLKGQLCIVRYVGPVADKSGEWLGVEWDDPARGKHDGTHGGKKYFQCRSTSPTAASFLRPNQPWDAPRTFYQALREKYMPEDAGTGGEIVYFSSKQAEEVGFEKFAKRQAALQGIHTIVLDHMRIRCQELEAEFQAISKTCQEITELDLSSNLFETLEEILNVCALFPKLKRLVLDGNRFTILNDASTASLSRVTTLALSDTLLRWNEISLAAASFPNVTSLALASNGLSYIGREPLPATLKELDLAGNAFLALTDLESLSSCKSLQTLLLKQNPIGLMKHDSAARLYSPLSETIVDVDLGYNAISSWSLFDFLPTAYPSLRHLRVTGNPLYKDLRAADGKALAAEDGYMLTIARLPQLETLNYSKITEKERLNAETYYLNQIAAELAKALADRRQEVIARHPRYRELCEEYGEPTVSDEPKPDAIDPSSLAARLVNITFILASGHAPGQPTRILEEQIPKTFNIYSVLGIIGKRLGVMPLRLRLVWETGDHDLISRDSGYEGPEWWDSSDDEDDKTNSKEQTDQIWREIELIAGTRALGTYIEGRDARIRVEVNEQ